MALPPPPGASAATTTNDAPAAAPAQNEAKKTRKTATTWGVGRGEDAIPVPQTFGEQTVDLVGLHSNLYAAVETSIGDPNAFVAAFETVGKDMFPGNKQGRTAYDVARMVKIIVNGKDRLEGKTSTGRPSKVAALQSQLDKLMSLLTPEQKAALGQ